MRTREEWLTQLMEQLIDKLLEPNGFDTNAETGLPMSDNIRVTCSWPTAHGLNKFARVIGECLHPRYSEGGRTEIFVSPTLSDPIEVASTLLHELLHAALPFKFGHGPKFEAAAHAVGLVGPAVATVAGEALKAELKTITDELGEYPHSKIIIGDVANGRPGLPPKQATRLLKAFCVNADCPTQVAKGFNVRITWKWAKDLRNGARVPANMVPLPASTAYAMITLACPFCIEHMAVYLPVVKGGKGGSGGAADPNSDEAPAVATGGDSDDATPDENDGDIVAPPDGDSDDGDDESPDDSEMGNDGDDGDDESPDDDEMNDAPESGEMEQGTDSNASDGGGKKSIAKGGSGSGNADNIVTKDAAAKRGAHKVELDCDCDACTKARAAAGL